MAYNSRYQYETSPRKIKPEYEPIKKTYPKKSTARKNKQESKKQQEKKPSKAKIISYIAIGFVTLFVISYRYAVIDQTYSDLTDKQSELSSIEKETDQLEATIESSLKLTTIEEEAEELLGMQKLESNQIVYVSLPKSDYVESSSEEINTSNSDSNWIIQIINKIIDTLN